MKGVSFGICFFFDGETSFFWVNLTQALTPHFVDS